MNDIDFVVWYGLARLYGFGGWTIVVSLLWDALKQEDTP